MEASLLIKEEGLNNSCPECQIKEMVSGKIYQCLVESPTCNYYFHFGATRFCKHPSRNLFIKKNIEKPSPSLFAKLDITT